MDDVTIGQDALGNTIVTGSNNLTFVFFGMEQLPADLMDALRSGRMQPVDIPGAVPQTAIQYYSCFISYSSKDDAFAKRMHADLQNSGVRCWFAPHDLPIGAKTRDAIDAAIKVRDKVLLILSNSVEECHRERLGRERGQQGVRRGAAPQASGAIPRPD